MKEGRLGKLSQTSLSLIIVSKLTVVTPVTVPYEMPEDVALGDSVVTSQFTLVVSVKICKRCKNCNFALYLQAEQNGKIRCTNVQAKCTRAYRVASLPTSNFSTEANVTQCILENKESRAVYLKLTGPEWKW